MSSGNILADSNLDTIKIVEKFIDPPSVNANTSTTQNVDMPGVRGGDIVVANMTVNVAGLFIAQARVNAADTITLVWANVTGSPIDASSQTIRFMIARKEISIGSFLG